MNNSGASVQFLLLMNSIVLQKKYICVVQSEKNRIWLLKKGIYNECNSENTYTTYFN